MLPRLAICLLLSLPTTAIAQWIPLPLPTNAEFRGLSVVNDNVVWASGTRGRIARTSDGGATWRVDTVPGAAALDFRDIQALDARTAIALSSGPAEQGQARIYRTTDAGASWNLVYSTELAGAFLDAVSFWDAEHGIVMGDPIDGRFFLLITSDGGKSWTRIPPEKIPPAIPGEAAFAASGTCLTTQGDGNAWIATGGGTTARVYRTTDRGETWSVSNAPIHAGNPSSGAFSVAFRDANNGVVVGGDYTKPHGAVPNVAVTTDGGVTWTLARGPLPAGYMSSVAYVRNAADARDANNENSVGVALVAVGLAGTAVSRDGGESWAMVDSVAYNSVSFANPGVGFTVGPRGRVARWVSAPDRSDPSRPEALTSSHK